MRKFLLFEIHLKLYPYHFHHYSSVLSEKNGFKEQDEKCFVIFW